MIASTVLYSTSVFGFLERACSWFFWSGAVSLFRQVDSTLDSLCFVVARPRLGMSVIRPVDALGLNLSV